MLSVRRAVYMTTQMCSKGSLPVPVFARYMAARLLGLWFRIPPEALDVCLL